MDAKENDGPYVVHAEIPGVKMEDIKFEVDGNVVSISADVKQEKEEKKGERVIRSERYHGSVSRTFILNHDVDEKTTQASWADGVLELTLPKKSSARQGRIFVQ